MNFLRRIQLLVMLLAALAFSGTIRAQQAAQAREGKSFLLHLPGVGGERSIDRDMVRGLIRAGLNDKIRIYDWTNDEPGLKSLQALKRNRAEAKKVAQIITRAYREDRDRPIYVTSHSGGTGIAVWALEALPEDVQIDTLVLLGSALSPTYDLGPALAKVRGKAYAFNSVHDHLILGTGTSTFGTIDGIKTPAAGLNGFEQPPSREQAYANLVQFSYDRSWMQFRNVGSHIGPMNSIFARDVLGPLMLDGVKPPTSQPSSSPAEAIVPR